jgi:hypothetical protein
MSVVIVDDGRKLGVGNAVLTGERVTCISL